MSDLAQVQSTQRVAVGYGLETDFGIMLPPGSKVAAFVRSTGSQSGDDNVLTKNLVLTLAAGLARVRAGLGDTVVCLPGHTESGVGTTGLANHVAGTRIIGVGQGDSMPTFRWTATTDNWALNQKNVRISGLRLRMEGANGVVSGITVTAADCMLIGNDIELASGATAVATTGITVASALATRFSVLGNIFRGVTGSSTNGILLSSTTDGIRICDNEFCTGVAVSTTAGLITMSGAITNVRILRNYFINNVASTCCVAIADVANTGILADNYFSVLTNGSAAAIGVIFTGSTNSLITCFQNFCSDEKQKSGVLSPAVAT